MTDALPNLNRDLVREAAFRARSMVALPDPAALELPERAVQFGTGAFLRGFVEDFLDEANRRGRFQGRIVMIGSTGSGRDRLIAEQAGLYTLVARGVERGAARQEARVIGVVSRALSAADDWSAVLECARNPLLELVFSNTTEVGITLDERDTAVASPPRSFPGKLTRFLYERARTFDCDPARGVVVIPCELIEDNGDRLRDIVFQLASTWQLGEPFIQWMHEAVTFCNTLVDRIVPGLPSAAALDAVSEAIGYRDSLLTTAELYRMFVIEGDAALRDRLPFGDAPGVVVTDDVRPYRLRKVHLLNGTHTALAPVALLGGCTTVREALAHERIGSFVRRVLLDEIVPALDVDGAAEFAAAVLDRFANPFSEHALFDITLHGTTKLRVRLVPAILRHAAMHRRVPPGLSFAFAAHLVLMRGDLQAARRESGLHVPPDEPGERIRERWARAEHGDTETAIPWLVRDALADTSLWQADLTALTGFADAVTDHVMRIRDSGIEGALDVLGALGGSAGVRIAGGTA